MTQFFFKKINIFHWSPNPCIYQADHYLMCLMDALGKLLMRLLERPSSHHDEQHNTTQYTTQNNAPPMTTTTTTTIKIISSPTTTNSSNALCKIRWFTLAWRSALSGVMQVPEPGQTMIPNTNVGVECVNDKDRATLSSDHLPPHPPQVQWSGKDWGSGWWAPKYFTFGTRKHKVRLVKHRLWPIWQGGPERKKNISRLHGWGKFLAVIPNSDRFHAADS